MDRTAIFVREALGDRNDDDRDIYSLIRELRAALAAAKKKAEEEARLREAWSVAARCAPNEVQEAVRDLVGELEMRLVETANQLKKAEAERDEAQAEIEMLNNECDALSEMSSSDEVANENGRLEREAAALRSRVAELEGSIEGCVFACEDNTGWGRGKVETLRAVAGKLRAALAGAEGEG